MNYKFFIAITILLLSASFRILNAQKVVTVTGSAQVEVTEDKSVKDVKEKAKELATVDALERAFGRVVIQGNSTYITNIQTGQKVETNTVFNTIANTSVKGEVLEILSENYTNMEGTQIIEGKKVAVTDILCELKIKAREIVTPPVEFDSFTLACPDEKCRSTSFRNNDQLYLYFSSPVSGYLSVYLDDKENANRLYPYSTMPADFDGGVPVEADKKYILFSNKPEFNYFQGKNILTDTYQLFSGSSQEINRVFIIFSKTPLNKPFLNDLRSDQNGYQIPKSLKSEDFQKWLNRYRSIDRSGVQVAITDITIQK